MVLFFRESLLGRIFTEVMAATIFGSELAYQSSWSMMMPKAKCAVIERQYQSASLTNLQMQMIGSCYSFSSINCSVRNHSHYSADLLAQLLIITNSVEEASLVVIQAASWPSASLPMQPLLRLWENPK